MMRRPAPGRAGGEAGSARRMSAIIAVGHITVAMVSLVAVARVIEWMPSLLEQPAVRLALRVVPAGRPPLHLFTHPGRPGSLGPSPFWTRLPRPRAGADRHLFLPDGRAALDQSRVARRGPDGAGVDGGGAAGLIGLKIVVILGAAAVVLRHLDRWHVPAIDAAIVVIYCSLLMLPWLGSVRPQIFTYAGFAILLTLLRRAERGEVRALWLAVPLMALWANLHGGFLAGVTAIAVWWGVSAPRRATSGKASEVGSGGTSAPSRRCYAPRPRP